jgi:Fur family transcriptional regulator, peroxide stress response regulator
MPKNEVIINKLREKGIKVTPQRIAIINYLETNRKYHPSIEDIYTFVIREYPTISLATVYNTMDKLEEINEVVKLRVGEENKVNYDYDVSYHNHFFCKKCGQIYDIEEPLAFFDKNEINGHTIEEVHAYFKGKCKKCQNS